LNKKRDKKVSLQKEFLSTKMGRKEGRPGLCSRGGGSRGGIETRQRDNKRINLERSPLAERLGKRKGISVGFKKKVGTGKSTINKKTAKS